MRFGGSRPQIIADRAPIAPQTLAMVLPGFAAIMVMHLRRYAQPGKEFASEGLT